MKNSNPSAIPEWVKALIEHPLSLPEDPNFKSTPPSFNFRQILELSERNLPFVNKRADFEAMKISRVFDEPFRL